MIDCKLYCESLALQYVIIANLSVEPLMCKTDARQVSQTTDQLDELELTKCACYTHHRAHPPQLNISAFAHATFSEAT